MDTFQYTKKLASSITQLVGTARARKTHPKCPQKNKNPFNTLKNLLFTSVPSLSQTKGLSKTKTKSEQA